MQKDFHYYMTFALAMKAGTDHDTAKAIAWSNQYTDELTEADLYGTQTQCGLLGNWKDRIVQEKVLIPFHFPPGDNKENRWIVTPNSRIAKEVCSEAVASVDLFRLGIALHSLQDTFSHQFFTGWEEPFNGAKWYHLIPALMPDIGHTCVGRDPDIISAVWTDPRTGETIRNYKRARAAAIETYKWLLKYTGQYEAKNYHWLEESLIPFWKINSYDNRKEWLLEWAALPAYDRYKSFEPPADYKQEFIKAARQQQSLVAKLIA